MMSKINECQFNFVYLYKLMDRLASVQQIYIITFIIIFTMKKNHLKILSSLIVKFTDVQAENFYFQVKFINCYHREIISFTKKLTLETGASLAYGNWSDYLARTNPREIANRKTLFNSFNTQRVKHFISNSALNAVLVNVFKLYLVMQLK